jgi:hypothetical protein
MRGRRPCVCRQFVPIAFRSGGKAISVCGEATCEMRGRSWEWMTMWRVWIERIDQRGEAATRWYSRPPR